MSKRLQNDEWMEDDEIGTDALDDVFQVTVASATNANKFKNRVCVSRDFE